MINTGGDGAPGGAQPDPAGDQAALKPMDPSQQAPDGDLPMGQMPITDEPGLENFEDGNVPEFGAVDDGIGIIAEPKGLIGDDDIFNLDGGGFDLDLGNELGPIQMPSSTFPPEGVGANDPVDGMPPIVDDYEMQEEDFDPEKEL